MASVYKRSHKLQEFVAHNANVNCLSLGRKSGYVMVTGGDDNKVNLWAIGKQSCFMSLCNHTTPIECVQFNHSEEVVIAGSRAGLIKVWDLEAARLVRTLTGHTDSIKCVDFHTYDEFIASGSTDCQVKFWDSRRKGCILTYNGHKGPVNSLKFSPDGYWIASGSDDSTVKIWDIRIGRILKEFNDHVGAVTTVTFHPHEFLLATGGSDRTVNFFDLENFNLVSSEKNVGSIRSMCFNPGGECLFAGVQDYMKVVGWEPTKLYDTEATMWGRVCDISTAQNKLVGASFHQTNVSVYLIDLNKVRPIGRSNDAPNPFTPNQSTRKSFSKAEKPVGLRKKSTSEVKTIEESTSSTDPEEDSTADITNLKDYNEIFHGRSLVRTPPPLESDVFESNGIDTPPDPTAPQILINERWNDSVHPASLDERINCPPFPKPVKHPPSPYTRSKSNLDQVYTSKISKADKDDVQTNKPKVQQAPKHTIQRQHSRDAQEKNHRNNNRIKHSASDANISKSSNLSSARLNNHVRKNSFSKPNRILSVPNVTASSKIPLNSSRSERNVPKSVPIIQTQPVDIYVSPKSSPDESLRNDDDEDNFIPVSIDKPVGLDLDDFLPKTHRSFGMQQQLPDMSETEVLGVILGGHAPMMAVLKSRQRQLQIVLSQYHSKDMKAGVETAVSFNNLALIVDILGVVNQKYTLWNLDLCVLLLPKIEELIQSKYEPYITRGCDSLKLILRHFGSVIKTNIQAPVGSFGVDIPREERFRKSQKCHECIMSIKSVLSKKISIPGNVGSTIKEIYTQIKSMFD